MVLVICQRLALDAGEQPEDIVTDPLLASISLPSFRETTLDVTTSNVSAKLARSFCSRTPNRRGGYALREPMKKGTVRDWQAD
jgi:hypothetical protein